MRHRNATTRPTLLRLLLAASLCVARVALAQTAAPTPDASARNAFYLQSIRPAIDRLQAITENPLADAPASASPDQYTFGYDGRVSLHRDFTRAMADIQTAPMGVAIQGITTTRGLLSLTPRTALSYANTVTDNEDLIGLALSQTTASTYALQQSVGSGNYAGALNMTRTLTHTRAFLAADTTAQTDALSFQGGLRRANDLSLKALRTQSDVPGGNDENTIAGTYNAAFSGGDSALGYTRSEKLLAGLSTITEKMDFAMPIAWRGQKLIAEHHATFNESGTVETATRSTHLLLPFAALGPNTLVDYSLVGADTGTGMAETGTAHFVNPFRFAGKAYGLEENYITVHQPGLSSDTLATRLAAPFAGGQAVIQHQTVSSEAAGVSTQQEQTSLGLPPISRLKVLSAQAAMTTTSTAGTEDNLKNFSVSVQPLKPLQVDALYSLDDKGEAQAAKTRQLHTRLALSKTASLQGQVSEAEIVGGTSTMTRLVEFDQSAGSGGVGLKAGYASYVAANDSVTGARRVEVVAGKPQTVAVNAAYSEYDPNTFVLIPNDAVVAFSMQHGDPKSFAVRCRYEDQPTRVSPLRALDMAMPALGGSLVMSYQDHPMGPDGATVRLATQYDAGLTRKVFGDVNMQVGYRYLDYDTDLVDRNIRLQLDGGHEEGVGKMAIAYYTGDFCPVPTDGTVTPGSSLAVSYSKVWGAASKLTIGVQRHTAPWHAVGDTSTEGRVEYSHAF